MPFIAVGAYFIYVRLKSKAISCPAIMWQSDRLGFIVYGRKTRTEKKIIILIIPFFKVFLYFCKTTISLPLAVLFNNKRANNDITTTCFRSHVAD